MLPVDDTPVSILICFIANGSLDGRRLKPTYEELLREPHLKFSNEIRDGCSDLMVECQIWDNNEPLCLPVGTEHKPFTNGWNWNEWLHIPLEFCDLPRTAQLALSVFDCGGPDKLIPVGGTTVSLFSKHGMFREGMLDLRIWPNVVADGHTPTTTPGKGHDKNDPSTYEMWKLDNLTERYRNGHIHKENLVERKHHMLARSVRSGHNDKDAKPNAAVRDILNKIVSYPPTQQLSSEEQDHVWKFRFYLSTQKKALAKFLKCVNWRHQNEVRQALHLIDMWVPMDIEGFARLASGYDVYSITEETANNCLEKKDSKDSNCTVTTETVLQKSSSYNNADELASSVDNSVVEEETVPVQATTQHVVPSIVKNVCTESGNTDTLRSNMYEEEDINDLASFLISRACKNFTLANYFFWYLLLECEDQEGTVKQDEDVRNMYVAVMKTFSQTLAKGTEAMQKKRETLTKQQKFIDKLVHLIKTVSRENAYRSAKIQKLKDLLADPDAFKYNFSKFDPIPLPLDPEVMITGIIPEKAMLFKSALMPARLNFITSEGTEYVAIFKLGDDLRQDQLILQMITLMDKLLNKENLDLKLTPYKVLATSTKHGFVQFIQSTTVAEVLASEGSIQNYFRKNHPQENAPYGIQPDIMDAYIRSCAGYCVITYLLGVGDRHLDNLLLTQDGRYILGRDPKPLPPPMKLSKEMVEAMGGINSEHYQEFKKLCYTAFLHLRRHANLMLNLFSLMTKASVPDIALEPDKAVKKVQDKLMLDLGDEEAVHEIQNLIDSSVTAVMAAISYVANILIAVNPYKDIPELYATKTIKAYQGKSLGELPPHVFAIADKAFRDMRVFKQSQSIIVSGESGAGKTESTKHLLKYLCEGGGAGPIEQKILDANPVLEAFGNAKTTRNNNSSRFGKFIEVHFDKKFQVAGGHISHYLLEKSRICSPLGEERSYHIFYMLMAGGPEGLRQKLGLTKPDDYNYLKNGCTRYFAKPATEKILSPGQKSAAQLKQGSLKDILIDDLEDFKELDLALSRLGMSEVERLQIYTTVAAVLHLGNVEFEDNPEDTRGGCRVARSGEKALITASKLLEIDPEELRQALVSRVMQSARGGLKGTVIMVPLKIHEANNARDALAKAIYSNLFDYIVSRINQSIPFQASSYYIGVLDIAGFEFFTVNSFEQFCINYCNEKLQQFFNERILKFEQELYKREGLSVPEISFTDNQDCIDVIEGKTQGIFALLDEESKLPKPSYAHFTESVHKTWGKNYRLGLPRSSKLKAHRSIRDDEGFLIKHFAGAVCYQTKQFIDKNNDALHASLEGIIQDSKNKLIQTLFATSMAQKGKLTFVSVGSKFKSQLQELLEKLRNNAILHSLKLTDKDFKFAITRVFFRPGKFAEFDKIMRSDPENLKSIVSNVKKWLVKSRWLKAQFCALTVIKMKNKIVYRRKALVVIQKNVRGYLVKKKYGMRIKTVKNLRLMDGKLKQLDAIAQQLKSDKTSSINGINQLKLEVNAAIGNIKKNENIDNKTVENLYSNLVLKIDQQMSTLQKKVQEQKSREEQESLGVNTTVLSRLRKIQEEMEKEKRIKEENERRVREEEENRKKKAEMEAKRKLEEEARLRQERDIYNLQKVTQEATDKKIALELQQQQAKLEQEERLYQEQLEQERQDRELALRLAQETNGQIEESPPLARKSQPSNQVKGKHDLSKWKYSELRDTINTSCDIELLEACRHEFHRRLKVYHAWKAKNKKRTVMSENERAPLSVLESAQKTPRLPQKAILDNNSQRFFRIPFQRPGGDPNKRGWWYAHFDGQYVARQMELHPDKQPILLVAGQDDMQMCELSLEETGLTRKRGAEILENEFNKEWEKNGACISKDGVVTLCVFLSMYKKCTNPGNSSRYLCLGRPLYLDAQATTPLDPRVLDEMMPYLTSYYGNPHSRTHAYGWESEAAVEKARLQVANLIAADPKEIIFTSGATESNNIAVKGVARFYAAKKKHIITTQTEHKCVLDSCRALEAEGFKVTYLPVNTNGIGAIYVRRRPRVRVEAIQSGGGQERGIRSGTVPTPLAVGLGRACEISQDDMEYDHARITRLSQRLMNVIFSELSHVIRNGDPVHTYPGCINLSFAYVEGESLLMALKDVALSSGSACTSASLEPSYVLRAIGTDEDLAHSSIRKLIMETILEQQRRYHEEKERLVDTMVKEMLQKKNTYREQINSDHRMKYLLDRYMTSTNKLIDLYEDKDGQRKAEVASLTGPNEFNEFYNRLKQIKDFYRKHPNEISVPMSVEFDELTKARENPSEEMSNLVEFTDEEGYGKFLDLHECYEKYINLKGIEVSLEAFDTPLKTLEERAQRLFSTKGQSSLDPSLMIKGTKGKANKGKEALRQKELAGLEAQIYRLSELVSEQRVATKENVQRKQARTDGERDDSENDESDNESPDEADDDVPYNPKNLPLGWDGKPIPYWLYKLHGLNISYNCEICGNYVYKGPKAFQRHFAEWRHAHGMRCLGIPNTAHFANVTQIEDALALWEKLKTQKQSERWQPETEEEYEDSQGNVVNRKTLDKYIESPWLRLQSYPALEENTIMMPSDLQADVIVPIVNFMYTVKKQPKPSPPLVNESTSPVPFKKVPWKRKTSSLQSHPASATYSNTRWNSDPVERDSASMADNTPKPTRFEWPDDLPPMAVYSSFDVSLTSKPLWTEQDNHKSATILQCAYCKKKLQSPVTLFTHVRVQHMKDARRDGIVSLDEIMDIQNDDNDDEIQANEGEALEQIHDHPAVEKVEEKVQHKSFLKERIKLISNVKVERLDESSAGKLGSNARIREAKSNAEPVAVTAAAATLSNLGGSLATNLGLVDIVVLDDNQQYILQQPQGQSGDTEFILPPELTGSEGILQAAAATGELNSTDELVMVLTDDYQDEQSQDQSDNSNIVVLYSHPVDGQQGQFITSQGNLLVNSEGMLEIRNGAAITTTAGQLLVNNGSTTTTQAAESPIESIDLIRREIEASEDIQREDIKNVLSEKEPEIEKKETEESTPIVEISNHQTDNNFVSNYVQEEKNADTTLDMTDSSTQDEAIPMEMNDLQLSSETGTDGQIMSQDEPQIPIQDPENVEGSMSTPVPASSQVAEEASTCLVNQPILKPESLNLEGELLMNAPQNFQSSIHEISENVEPMEVDTEQMPNETLCNTKDEAGVDEIDNTLSNTVDAPNENSQEYLKVNDAEPLKEESVQKLKNNEEANFEQSICAAGADICEENENPVSSENHEHGEPVGENNPNDSNDNLQDSYGAFTEETQRSSTETSQKDLNKEILEDWDDTDSQQSQTQEQQAQDAALINVSENVSELMDDWEEEDEDQTKG
ncbi:hypothetical protein HUJ05_011673 [Dendroctonus ponderosae]|nr:hypothetical protein HUJ05_011673 [Dendroctonus ponderosae]